MDTMEDVKEKLIGIGGHLWKYSFILLPIPLGFLLDPIANKIAEYILERLELSGYTEMAYRIISIVLLFALLFLALSLWNIVWDRLAVVSKVFVGMFFSIIYFVGLEALGIIVLNTSNDLSPLSLLTHNSGLGFIYTVVFLLILLLLSLWLEWGDSKAVAEEDEYLRDMIKAEVEATLAGQAMGNVFEKKEEEVATEQAKEKHPLSKDAW